MDDEKIDIPQTVEIRDPLTHKSIRYCNKEEVINLDFVKKLLTFIDIAPKKCVNYNCAIEVSRFHSLNHNSCRFCRFFQRFCFDAMYAPHKPL